MGPPFFMFFARRRGDFAEMMGVRGEGRGACSPELTHSQPSRHTVPPLRLVFFSVFFNILDVQIKIREDTCDTWSFYIDFSIIRAKLLFFLIKPLKYL